MMKCEICESKIETLFLNKIRGTYFSKGKKKKAVCGACQKKFTNDEIMAKLF